MKRPAPLFVVLAVLTLLVGLCLWPDPVGRGPEEGCAAPPANAGPPASIADERPPTEPSADPARYAHVSARDVLRRRTFARNPSELGRPQR